MSLFPLEVKGMSTGLYGRACVSVADPKDRPLPAHRFSAGDEVRLYSSKGSKGGAPDEGPSEITGGSAFRSDEMSFITLLNINGTAVTVRDHTKSRASRRYSSVCVRVVVDKFRWNVFLPSLLTSHSGLHAVRVSTVSRFS